MARPRAEQQEAMVWTLSILSEIAWLVGPGLPNA